MERRPDDEGNYRVLPDRADPCIWMVAGLLSYRLCDRAYDCEHCPLDAAIRGAGPAPSPAVEAPESRPPWDIRDGLSYHRAYGWVAPGPERTDRWGVDGFTARLLDRVTAVILPATGTRVVRGTVACWAADDGDLVPLRSPLTGIVVRTNRALRADPSLLTLHPYDEGWLLEVERGEGQDESREWIDARERRARAAEQTRRMLRSARGYLHVDQAIGPTAQDGGIPIPDLRRLLGRSRYHRLVGAVLR